MTAGLGRQRLMLSTVRWRHSEGKMRDFTTLDAFDYQYGLMARYTPSSRPKNVTKIKANLEFQKSSDDFIINSAIVLLISLAFVYYGNQICGKKLSKYLGFM